MPQRAITSGSPVGSGHIRALDGLRAFALIFVFCFHFQLSKPLTYSPDSSAAVRNLAVVWNTIAMRLPLGVDIFFVLSGFLITSILLKARGTTNYFRVFYARRCLRIFPVYYVAVFLTFLAGSYPYRVQFWFWINASNVISCINPSVVLPLTHFWSLAVEEQFYLVWPLLVFWLSRRTLAAICALMIPLQYGLRMLPFIARLNAQYSNFTYRLTPFHSEGLFLGALVAVLVSSGLLRTIHLRRVKAFTLVAFAWFLLIYWPHPGWSIWVANMASASISSVSAGVVAWILLAPSGKLSNSLSLRPLALIGRYSYCMYVVHQPLIFHIDQLTPVSLRQHRWCWPIIGIGIFLLTFGIAALSWRLLEEPFLDLKRYFMYTTSPKPGETRST